MAFTTQVNSKTAKPSGTKPNNSISQKKPLIQLTPHTFPTRYVLALSHSIFEGLTPEDVSAIVGFFVANPSYGLAVKHEAAGTLESVFYFPNCFPVGPAWLDTETDIRALGRSAIITSVGYENLYITGKQTYFIKVGSTKNYAVGLCDFSSFTFD